ncbi:hypothetical protein BDN67DRAFT_985476 [Paxillus ammoniavirescens]|nr:hypothetical protein BDN67DRAFT_985476 [Paxillus ammoniavirescens]
MPLKVVYDTVANVGKAAVQASIRHEISQSPVRETVEPVQVAAGRDKVFWVVVLIPTYNAVEKFLYTLIHCRKPEDPDEEVPAATGTNSSQTAADNTASSKQSGHPETGDGTENAPTLASNLIISTQPQRTAAMRLSGESLSAEHYRSETPVGDSQVYNQPESIEMVGIRETLTVSAHASPQPTPSAEPLSSAIPSCEPSSSVPNVTSAPLIVSSPEERALIQEYRRHKDKSVVLSGPAPRDRDSYIHLEPSTSLPPSSGSVTPSTSSAPFLVSPQAHSHIHAGPSPILHTTPALLSPSPLSAVSRHSHSLHQPSTTSDVQSLDQTAQCVDNIVVEARDSINTGSLASPAADEADRQHLILHLQDQVEQCRRQLDDAVAAMRKAESERDGLATGSAGSGLSFMQDGPPRGSELITDSQSDPSAFSNVLYQGHPSGSAQSISGSIEAEEQANEKKEENTLSDPTNKAIDSQRSVHPPHHHGPTRPTMVSPAPTAADMANVQRVLLRLQQQVEQLRQRVDDPMWKVAAEGDGLDTGSPAVEAGPLLRN